MPTLTGAAGAALILTVLASPSFAEPPEPRRPVHTYSIVARDPATGQLGVAVQSHWFSVGSIVSWAESGVGAVATQSFVDPAYGPRGLDRMRGGESAPEALAALVAADEGREVRQVAMVDAEGPIGPAPFTVRRFRHPPGGMRGKVRLAHPESNPALADPGSPAHTDKRGTPD